MRKIPSLFIGITLMIGLGTSPSFATVSPGTKCSKIDSKVVVGNKTYTCIKSGTRKVWSKAAKSTETKPIQAKRVVLTWENAAANASQMISDIWNNAQPKKINPLQVITDRSIISTPNASFGQTDDVIF